MDESVLILKDDTGVVKQAFQLEGYEVISAQEAERADIVAGQLSCGSKSADREVSKNYTAFLKVLYEQRPKVFVAELEAKTEEKFRSFLMEAGSLGYRIVYRFYDFQKMTGLPECESRIYVVGSPAEMEKQLELPSEPYGGDVSEVHAAMLRQIARTIHRFLDSNTPENRQERNNARFKRILEGYLNYRRFQYQKDCIDKMQEIDFVIQNKEENICIVTKLYTSHAGIDSKVMRMCERIWRYHEVYQGACVLATGNLVEDAVKKKCRELYHTYVWDVRNLLWLFRDVPDIQKEFVSLLNYTIEDVVPERPEPAFLAEDTEPESKTSGFREKLDQISPGREDAARYEEVATEILKYILGEYLTLWEKQKASNNNLYRFDLYCKIKHGELPEFFDTIKNYYNTKYIIFEFKNYESPIAQKEIYTTEKYLYRKALRSVAVIISRKGADSGAIAAAEGCLREDGKLILCLSDADLLELVDIQNKGEQTAAERLQELLDAILIRLGK